MTNSAADIPPIGPFKPLDVHIGRRVRWCRERCNWTQIVLGQKLGVTFQQVQKYERGANSLTASRLHQLATLFDVPVSFFFDGYPESLSSSSAFTYANPLARASNGITDPDLRRALLYLMKILNRWERKCGFVSPHA